MCRLTCGWRRNLFGINVLRKSNLPSDSWSAADTALQALPLALDDPRQPDPPRLRSVGRPLPEVELRIIDKQGTAQPCGAALNAVLLEARDQTHILPNDAPFANVEFALA